MNKILIATGGTGGHIYPALITAEELRRRGWDVLFIGVFGTAEEKLKSKGFAYVTIPARGFVAKGWADKLRAIGGMLAAMGICGKTMRAFRPRVVIGFGGYSAFPAVLTGFLSCRLTMIHEQNVVPGAANRILSQVASRVCVGFKDTMASFPKTKTVWTGTPFRSLSLSLDRDVAAKKFGLDPHQKIIFVFGGSQGARRINEAFFGFMQSVDKAKGLQVIHAAGRHDAEDLKARYASIGVTAYVREFIENIDEAYAACDVAVARAGAGTVTELGVLGVPAVLIPYPGARDHQRMNAEILEQAGGASIIEEKSLSSQTLGATIFDVITRSVPRRDIKASLQDQFVVDPSKKLADEIDRLKGNQS